MIFVQYTENMDEYKNMWTKRIYWTGMEKFYV